MNIYNLKANGVKVFEFDIHQDKRGSLTVANIESEIPFQVLRYFLIFGVPPREVRGQHAHKECHQFIVCTNGSCKVAVDDGKVKDEIILKSPNMGLYLPPMIWGVQSDYSKDASLLVLASHPYDKADYITDYSEFKKLI